MSFAENQNQVRDTSLAVKRFVFMFMLAFAMSFSAAFILVSQDQAALAAQKEQSWESLVLKGNEYRDRGRYFDSRRFYENALKILGKQGPDDVRKAIILHDMGESYRGESNLYRARLIEVEAHHIYKEEIKRKQLGYEYSAKKPIVQSAGSLRPACYLCHENWKVVPILYGESTGYDGETPEDSDDEKYTHKPGGRVYEDQRWYCRACHQSF